MSTVTTYATTARAATLDDRLAASGLPLTFLILLLVCAVLAMGAVAFSVPLVAVAAGLLACVTTTIHAFFLLIH